MDERPVADLRVRVEWHHWNFTVLQEDGSLYGGDGRLLLLLGVDAVGGVVVVVVVVVDDGVEARLGAPVALHAGVRGGVRRRGDVLDGEGRLGAGVVVGVGRGEERRRRGVRETEVDEGHPVGLIRPGRLLSGTTATITNKKC